MADYWYHLTPIDRVPSIKEFGLLPGSRRVITHPSRGFYTKLLYPSAPLFFARKDCELPYLVDYWPEWRFEMELLRVDLEGVPKFPDFFSLDEEATLLLYYQIQIDAQNGDVAKWLNDPLIIGMTRTCAVLQAIPPSRIS